MRSDDVEFDKGLRADHEPAGAVRIRRVDLATVRRRRRQGEPKQLARRALRHLDRDWRGTVVWNVEWRAIGHYAGGAAHGEFTLLRQIAVDLDMREAPWIGRGVPRPALNQMFKVAIALLQVMRAKEKPFRPKYFTVPGHRRPRSLRQRRSPVEKRASIASRFAVPIITLRKVEHERPDQTIVVAMRLSPPARDIGVPEPRLA